MNGRSPMDFEKCFENVFGVNKKGGKIKNVRTVTIVIIPIM